MVTERLVMAIGLLAFGVLAVVLWGDYLHHSAEVYDARDAASAEVARLDRALAGVDDAEEWAQLEADRSVAEQAYLDASRRIDDMDGWGSAQWKLKNAFRLASPAFATLFGAFMAVSILHPLRRD